MKVGCCFGVGNHGQLVGIVYHWSEFGAYVWVKLDIFPVFSAKLAISMDQV